MNGIVSASTGTPFTVYDSSDPSLQGDSPEISGFVGDRPNLVGNPNNGPKTAKRMVQHSGIPARHPTRNLRQCRAETSCRPPASPQWDFGVSKNFRLAESTTLQFRGEFFNVLNRVNFGVPNDDINSPTFGQVQTAAAPRQIQFALKLLF